jgi:TPR repeat protein
MKSQNQFCLIGQTNCGRKPGNPVCPWCGIDERVVYPSQADLEEALAEATKKYEHHIRQRRSETHHVKKGCDWYFDPATHSSTLKGLAHNGSSEAACDLGNIYRLGVRGEPKNISEEIQWFRIAAELGNAEAQYWLGQLYYEGRGVSQDYAQAAQWFYKAAEQGHIDAQAELDFFHDNITHDQVQTYPIQISLLYRARVTKLMQQGFQCEKGDGLPQDHAQAEHWYREAIKIDRKLLRPSDFLANLYWFGYKDKVAACALYMQNGPAPEICIEGMASQEIKAAEALAHEMRHSDILQILDNYLKTKSI